MYDILAELGEATVVADYEVKYNDVEHYQSEAELENMLIRLLEQQGYEFLSIHEEKDLTTNLRQQLERLNGFQFTDKEWKVFFNTVIANDKEGIVEKTIRIQQDYIQVLKREDGSSFNVRLIDKDAVHNNQLQVINQYTEVKGNHENRYDVTILVNGLPLVHVELKRRGVAIREAFNQIERYQRDSFWAGSGLFEYVQVFVISNGVNTKYYSNTTRDSAVNEKKKSGANKSKKTSNSFEFTSYWADGNNKVISDLADFTKTFFAKHTLLNVLTKYCVFSEDKVLRVMRPYQIAATERILNRLVRCNNYKNWGKQDAGGYIWHTTGSGKTLTSFKTAQLAMKLPFVDRVVFVVDRNDLDYQTIKEYENFQKGSVSQSKNTAVLKKHFDSANVESKIVVTTIQKLAIFVKKNKTHPVCKEHVVFIFDECHRSQFGEMHSLIVKNFKSYIMFGFTGTPIFAENANMQGAINMRTTQDAFGDRLHTYTILDAIRDGNVLKFKVSYHNTIKSKYEGEDKIPAVDREKALMNPVRIEMVTKYVLDNFDRLTKRNQGIYSFNKLVNIKEVVNKNAQETKGKVRMNGFNALFAASSVPAAKAYYQEFQKQIAASSGRKLKIALIYSYAPNEDLEGDDFLAEENNDEIEGLDQSSRDFLEKAIDNYNELFNVNYDTSAEKFSNYYKDVSLRMKNRELDMLIVCNMFLTGFDATTLNTLFVDKNLKMHGLIQAFSRTNRILNRVKNCGNIECFRNLDKKTNEALALFGDKDAKGIVLIKTFKEYYEGYDEEGTHYEGYGELIARLKQNFPLGQVILGEQAEKDFIKLFGKILRLRNILAAFDEFMAPGVEVITPYDLQNYTGIYIDLRDKYVQDKDKVDVSDDLIFEMELVKQIEVNIDYILMLVKKYHESNCQDKTIRGAIDKAIGSSPDLRSKRDLIERFIDEVSVSKDITEDWRKFVVAQKDAELENLIATEKLKPEQTRKFLNSALEDGTLKTGGTDINDLLPPMKLFGSKGASRSETLHRVIEKIKAFFERFFGMV